MLHLFCHCGYPIIASARWDGNDFCIHLHDGYEGDLSKSILACPECGAGMRLGELRPRPRHTNHWFTWSTENDRDVRLG
jgi:hypothetical protein